MAAIWNPCSWLKATAGKGYKKRCQMWGKNVDHLVTRLSQKTPTPGNLKKFQNQIQTLADNFERAFCLMRVLVKHAIITLSCRPRFLATAECIITTPFYWESAAEVGAGSAAHGVGVAVRCPPITGSAHRGSLCPQTKLERGFHDQKSIEEPWWAPLRASAYWACALVIRESSTYVERLRTWNKNCFDFQYALTSRNHSNATKTVFYTTGQMPALSNTSTLTTMWLPS